MLEEIQQQEPDDRTLDERLQESMDKAWKWCHGRREDHDGKRVMAELLSFLGMYKREIEGRRGLLENRLNDYGQMWWWGPGMPGPSGRACSEFEPNVNGFRAVTVEEATQWIVDHPEKKLTKSFE